MSIEFAKPIAQRLVGKIVEISQSIEHESFICDQFEIRNKSVIRGKLLEVDGELLVVLYTNIKTGQSNKVYINSWSVATIVEPMNNINLADVYSRDQDRRKLIDQLKRKVPIEP